MFSWLTRILSNWVTLMIVAGIFTPHFRLENVETAFFAALILSIVNAVVKPVLIFFTLPLTLLSFGLFLLVINAFTLQLTAWLIDGFTIDGFGYALLAGIIISLLNFLIQKIVLDNLKKR